MELDGGIDINSQMKLGPQSGDLRDHPPGLSTDVFLGYEQMQFVQRTCEKFAARDVSRDIIGSPGAETYQATIGTAGFTVTNGSGYNNSTASTATYAYHDPTAHRARRSERRDAPVLSRAAERRRQRRDRVAEDGVTSIRSTRRISTTRLTARPIPMVPAAYAATRPRRSSNLPISSTATTTAATSPIGGRPPARTLPPGTVLRYKIGAFSFQRGQRFPEQRGHRHAQEEDGDAFPDHQLQRDDGSHYPHNDYGTNRHRPERGIPRPAHAAIPQPQRPRVDLQHQRADVLLRRPAARRADRLSERKRHAHAIPPTAWSSAPTRP